MTRATRVDFVSEKLGMKYILGRDVPASLLRKCLGGRSASRGLVPRGTRDADRAILYAAELGWVRV